MSKRVFVSSTFVDLETHRQAVVDAIRQLGAIDIAMEHFGAHDERPKDECVRLIKAESDVFVGIYAHRYGYVPEGDNISIAEAEYNAATKARLARFIYLVDEATPWVPAHIDRGKAATQLQEFKQKLKSSHTCDFFTNKDELATKVAADLGRYFTSGAPASSEGHRGILHEPKAEWVPPLHKNRWRYKVIAFDLDGTLLRGQGFVFSWEAVWFGLRFARSIQTDLKREYRRKAQSSSDDLKRIQAYREWCQKACNHFMKRRLTRQKLATFIDPLKLTNNFKPSLSRMRNEGFVLAIISGGINCFLEQKVPDFKEWFDYVFINELKFDHEGFLSDVIATEFDFEGKAKALELVCDRVGCTTDETIFVGDAFNDESIMVAAGLSIAYPPRDRPVRGVSQKLEDKDNLDLLLQHVCVK